MLTVLLMRMQETDTSDANIMDLVGEVANTISGNARRDFGRNFIISVPTMFAAIRQGCRAVFALLRHSDQLARHSAKLVVCLE